MKLKRANQIMNVFVVRRHVYVESYKQNEIKLDCCISSCLFYYEGNVMARISVIADKDFSSLLLKVAKDEEPVNFGSKKIDKHLDLCCAESKRKIA